MLAAFTAVLGVTCIIFLVAMCFDGQVDDGPDETVAWAAWRKRQREGEGQ